MDRGDGVEAGVTCPLIWSSGGGVDGTGICGLLLTSLSTVSLMCFSFIFSLPPLNSSELGYAALPSLGFESTEVRGALLPPTQLKAAANRDPLLLENLGDLAFSINV
jgi:hypothetical protein